MSKIPTAKDYLKRMLKLGMSSSEIMKGFAKRHVEAALQKAYENADLEYYGDEVCYNKDSILNAYPLTNIK